MADLFGEWVPQEWIDAVLKAVSDSPRWNFLFLTKNPKRLIDINWPKNAWVGTTVDVQRRAKAAEEAFRQIKAPVKFISCEPLQEKLVFNSMEMFDWIIIGGRSRCSGLPEFQPQWEWVESIVKQAREYGLKVYFKPNLIVRPREYPEEFK
jgi:protein gp37